MATRSAPVQGSPCTRRARAGERPKRLLGGWGAGRAGRPGVRRRGASSVGHCPTVDAEPRARRATLGAMSEPASLRIQRRIEWTDTDASGAWHNSAAFNLMESAEVA